MARASLNWTVRYSKISQVSISTIKRIETNDGFEKATKANLKLIRKLLKHLVLSSLEISMTVLE